ncbi:guanine nucleotide-releasing factor 2 [Drosophila busckii]|uniref:guanine nucleotide-releasing factor 2 n=1 Tax=Drosophila busckii TaxID=30019 RepID=UPI00083EE7CD|nr:guanine nucleotide-releasing factor 2 [Drosophila busckii]
MPQFDESFLSDCALAERWHFYSYNVQQQQANDEQQQQQQHVADEQQSSLWLPLDNNNNSSNNNNNNKYTLHNMKFQRRCKYKKLPRLALSTTSLSTPLSTHAAVKNVVRYGSISSPSTPSNCSAVGVGGGCNSSSNNSINSSIYAGHSSSSGSTPPPPQAATTPQQQQQQYNTRLGAAAGAGTGVGVAAVVPPAPPTSGGATGSSGHKNSLKGTKLARRARSFKDDLIEKISLMRTTNNTLGRSHSPHSPRSNKHGHKPPPSNEEVQRSTQTLETHVKDISNALKHFRDVILKKKLEVLPGNGTVILETIASMYSVIQSYTLNENSAIMSCATQQVYQSLGKLIKLCDEVMLSEKSGECASLSNENVREVIDLLEDAVRNLVTLAQGKLKEQDQSAFRYSAGGLCGIGAAADIMGAVTVATVAGSPAGGTVAAAAAALVAQRTSLPDIALTPKERDILMGQGNDSHPIRGSHSTESILRDTSPPPKPPLPNRASNPPPLPPKRRSQPTATPAAQSAQFAAIAANQSVVAFPYAQSHNISINSDLDCSSNTSLLNYGVDRLSVRSRSPDENSQCSFDSALNHSRDEEEQPTQLQLQPPPPKKPIMLRKQLDEDLDKLISYSFVSMTSFRTSTQSVSKRSSEHSVQSSTKSSSSNSELAFGISETTVTATATATSKCSSSSSDYQQRQQTTTTTTTSTASESHAKQLTTELAPALPPKTQQQQRAARLGLDLDELDDSSFELAELRQQQHMSSQQLHQWQSKHHSLIEPPRSARLPSSCSSAFERHLTDKPPPLPMKKKHILAYMEICSANSHSVEQHRHTMHAYNISRNMSHSQTMNIMSVSKQLSPELETPPALPPKNYKQRKPSTAGAGAGATPPASPKSMLGDVELRQHRMQTVSEELSDAQTSSEQQGASATEEAASGGGATGNGNVFFCHELPSDNAKPASSPKLLLECANVEQQAAEAAPLLEQEEEEQRMLQQLQLLDDDEELEEEEEEEQEEPANQLPNMLEEIDITPYLILKKREEDGPEVKGGYIDALIVHASRVQKVADNAFSEAFITTFRTFIQPIDVIEKLTHRYTYFFCQVHDQKQKAAKETFSLLVRVVNDLTSTDLTNQLLSLLVEFVYQLVCSGQLYLAKLLRNKFVEKVTLFKDQRSCAYMPELGPSSSSTGTAQLSLLDLKSLEIAEQMTLLDAELFMKIEIPEVLLFAKDQCEEKSPNLNKFTEHFNKMSFWARSKILRLHDTKEREKHVNKFIKIMKHLRKMNNYNSYLALLSALDSGPIRRLEWQKGTTEEVRGFCALIDSSSSFRAYRQALAETNPPCIPYIGLVLQDLTFVHVGNQDYVSKGVINFSKRWQQYNIIVNMKRFKKCAYPFRRNERIIGFFDNFKDFMGEEEMWQISERIKPRGKRQPNY